MRGQPGWRGGQACPGAGAVWSPSLRRRVPGKPGPTGPFPADFTQNKEGSAGQVGQAGAGDGPLCVP